MRELFTDSSTGRQRGHRSATAESQYVRRTNICDTPAPPYESAEFPRARARIHHRINIWRPRRLERNPFAVENAAGRYLFGGRQKYIYTPASRDFSSNRLSVASDRTIYAGDVNVYPICNE